jgi:hypothetical protein
MNKTCAGLVLLAALVWISPGQLRADTATPQKSGSATKPKPHTTRQHPIHKVSARSSQHRSTRYPTRRHVSSRASRAAAARRRRAQLRPEPQRIEEIQQALVQAGYSNAPPNGRWDDQTREAMRRYQADHGFPVTGLPEAKSLMKLGLGPHPLPADLDSSSGSAPSPGAESSAPAKSPTPTTPDAQPTPP